VKRHALAPRVAGAALTAALLVPGAQSAAQAPADPVNNPTIDYEAPERPRVYAGLPDPMPPIPESDTLREFSVSATSSNSFGVDPASLQVIGKRFIQFTLVVTSPRGVRNIGYEAIDCESRESALLATGRDDTGWSPVQPVNWRPLSRGDTVNPAQRELARSWCEGGAAAGEPRELLRRLAAVPQRYRY